jgi:hypothetical protein
MRIFRTIIVLTGIAVLLPSPPERSEPVASAVAAGASVPGIVATAAQTVSDVASFCARQPGVCETAGYLANKMEAKAKYSVKLLYEWANESAAVPEVSDGMLEAKTDPITTGSAPGLRLAAAQDGQSTLKLEDLIPEWRGPAKIKKS